MRLANRVPLPFHSTQRDSKPVELSSIQRIGCWFAALVMLLEMTAGERHLNAAESQPNILLIPADDLAMAIFNVATMHRRFRHPT